MPLASARFVLTALLGFAFATWSAPALAQQDLTIEFNLNEAAASKYGIDTTQAEADLEARTMDSLKTHDPSAFLLQMARANNIADKGMGVDYASNPQRFVFGASIGTGVNSNGVSFQRGGDNLPAGGFAFQSTLMAGLNLGAFSKNDKSAARRFIIYGNALAAETKLDPFKAAFTSLGAHLQIKVIGVAGNNGKPVEWGGLDLTSGLEWSRYKLNLQDVIPIELDQIQWNADGGLSIASNAMAVPVELSTNLRVLIATVFVGGAVDIGLDSEATIETDLRGQVVVKENGESIGNGLIVYRAQGGEIGTTGRIFGGAQVNVYMVKLYGQLNVAFDDSFGGHVGMRFAL